MIDFHPGYIALKITALIYAATILSATAALHVRYAIERLRSSEETECDCLRCRAARGEAREVTAAEITADTYRN